MISYRPKYFVLQELVDPDTYNKYGNKAWMFIDPRVSVTLDQLRERFGPIMVNDWNSGGRFKYSGYRPPEYKDKTPRSQHRAGRAMDCKFKGSTPDLVRGYIIDHPQEFPYITTLEDGAYATTWVHFDVRDNGGIGVKIIRP